jgi:RimJ/RimL family protein N-acetyltransferase
MVAPTTRTDGVVTIRPYRPDDADALYAAVRESVDELRPWLPWAEGYTRADSEEWIATRADAWAQGEAFSFCVTDAEEGTLLGGVGLNQLDATHRRANLGYWVRSSRTGSGVATRAVRLTAQFGIETAELQRIEITMDVRNRASQRVAEKAGAVREGRLRNRLRVSDEPRDALLYSIIPADFGARS